MKNQSKGLQAEVRKLCGNILNCITLLIQKNQKNSHRTNVRIVNSHYIVSHFPKMKIYHGK